MSTNQNTVFASSISHSTFEPRARVEEDGRVAINPTHSLYLSMSVEQWRELCTVVETAIAGASA